MVKKSTKNTLFSIGVIILFLVVILQGLILSGIFTPDPENILIRQLMTSFALLIGGLFLVFGFDGKTTISKVALGIVIIALIVTVFVIFRIFMQLNIGTVP